MVRRVFIGSLSADRGIEPRQRMKIAEQELEFCVDKCYHHVIFSKYNMC